MMELQKGRPMDTTGRLAKETRTYDLLDSLGIEYNRIDHAPAMTMEVCQEIDKTLQAVICKNLFLCNRQETAFYLLMIPDTKVFHTKDLSAQIHSARLSFAKPEYMEKFLDITPGSVSVLGLMNDTENHVQLLIDEDVLTVNMWAATPASILPACACAQKTWWKPFCPPSTMNLSGLNCNSVGVKQNDFDYGKMM